MASPPLVALIDDDAVQLQIYRSQFNAMGASVSIFQSGQEFLGAAGEDPSNWDLVVVDYHMPGMNGIETIQNFGEHAPRDTEICLLSGNDLHEDDATLMSQLGLRFVPKTHKACAEIWSWSFSKNHSTPVSGAINNAPIVVCNSRGNEPALSIDGSKALVMPGCIQPGRVTLLGRRTLLIARNPMTVEERAVSKIRHESRALEWLKSNLITRGHDLLV